MAAIASADVTTEPPDSIGLKKSLFGGTQFVYGEVVEDPFSDDGNVGGFIESLDDEALSAEYMSAEKHYMGGMVLGAISGGLLGWYIGGKIGGSDPSAILLVAGGVLFVPAWWVDSRFQVKLENVVERYNSLMSARQPALRPAGGFRATVAFTFGR